MDCGRSVSQQSPVILYYSIGVSMDISYTPVHSAVGTVQSPILLDHRDTIPPPANAFHLFQSAAVHCGSQVFGLTDKGNALEAVLSVCACLSAAIALWPRER